MRENEIGAEETLAHGRGPRPLKIAMSYGASYGWLNMGDTAMLQNIVAFIGTAMPNATITCLSERLDRTTELIDTEHMPSLASYCERRGFIATAVYRVPKNINRKLAHSVLRSVLRIVEPMWFAVNAYLHAMFGFSLLVDSRARRLLHTMRDYDALCASGGGYLGDHMVWSVTWPRLLTYASFKWHGKPVVLSGQQIGPLTGRLHEAGIQTSMDGRGRVMDNVFIERLWRSVKYEEIYLHDYTDGIEARRGLDRYFRFYNTERQRQSLDNRTPADWYFGWN